MRRILSDVRERIFHTRQMLDSLASIQASLRDDQPREGHADLTPSALNFPDVSNLLHESRSAYLRAMPRVKEPFLSAGCSGTWYFRWIEDKTKLETTHIGIEYYSPKPADLPANVQWISNTVGNMVGVSDVSCGLVFSGQNLEHLWQEDVVGFFLESWRVLRRDGVLVIDSPNRLVTEPLLWSHPEHTVEFTPDEAAMIAHLAGFDVTAMRGIWICRDADSGEVLPIDPNSHPRNWTTIERIVAAVSDPHNSLLWWMEARKSDRSPDRKQLEGFVNKVYAQAWPERSARFILGVGSASQDRSTFVAEKGQSGPILYGPYMPLKAGTHTVAFPLGVTADNDEPAVIIDVIGKDSREITSKILRPSEIKTARGNISLSFILPELEFGVQARVISFGNAAVSCGRPIIT